MKTITQVIYHQIARGFFQGIRHKDQEGPLRFFDQWKQEIHFQRESHVNFTNPDFVQYAQSFGAKGYRIEKAEALVPTIKQAIIDNTVVVIDCAVDYDENMKLTKKLGELICVT